MTLRAALYARFSSAELQSPKSIDDQLHECRRYAERIGATIVATFTDYGISAAAMANRPGVLDLTAAAAQRPRPFDVVIADELSRLTRDGGHAYDLFHDLEALGITIDTPNQGQLDEIKAGVLGIVASQERKATGARVRRGLSGLVRAGKQTGPAPVGYRIRLEYDAAGEPIRGLREIDPAAADLVRRIFAEYAGGSSPHAIALRLNDEAVATPTGRGRWTGSRLGKLLSNALYMGETVWGRQTWTKDRRTGKTRSRAGDPANLVRHAVPELAIVSPELWAAVQARRADQARKVAAAGPAAANSPRRLLTGLVRCGLCNASMSTLGRDHRYRCWRRVQGGMAACDNARGVPAERLEAEVLALIQRDLLHPDAVEAVVREYREGQAAKGRAAGGRRHQAERELAEVRRRADTLMDLPADLIAGPSVAGKLRELDARRLQLEAELAAQRSQAEIVALHPVAPARYRQLIEDLTAHLLTPDAATAAARDAARAALHKVITGVLIHPEPGRGHYRLEVQGDAHGLLPIIAEAVKGRRTGT